MKYLYFILAFFVIVECGARESKSETEVSPNISKTQCGNSAYEVTFNPEEETTWGWEKVFIKFSQGNKTILKEYEHVHFGIACLQNPNKKNFIVYQAYCGGSACRDFDNWGIINADILEVLIEPTDTNSAQAEKMFGGVLKPF